MQFKDEILGKVSFVAPDDPTDTNVTEAEFMPTGMFFNDQPRTDKLQKIKTHTKC